VFHDHSFERNALIHSHTLTATWVNSARSRGKALRSFLLAAFIVLIMPLRPPPKLKLDSVARVRERTVLNERRSFIGEGGANFCG
jgi:hypothetical protein